MFASLKKIKNPSLRIITAAVTASALVTMLSAIVIGWTAPRNPRSHKIGVYATLVAAVGGGIVGLINKPTLDTTSTKEKTQTKKNQENWQDWRNFVVMRKVKESEEITSFYLKPKDGESIPSYQPGQFLTIKLTIPEQERPVIRTYSLSDYHSSPEYYRLSIKRELPPQDLDVPPGIASNFMRDRVEEGSIIQCKPPQGKFFLDINRTTPAILLSNGVGITPMIAMAKGAISHNPQRQIWFIHGAKNADYQAFREDMLELSANYPNFRLHYRYSRPQPQDEGKYHSQGYVDIELVKELLTPSLGQKAQEEAEYFLCGSTPFMDSLREGLKTWGIDDSQVFFESFSKPAKKSKTPATNTNKKTEIVFSESNRTVSWTSEYNNILELAEANGLDPDYSCRQGVCLTCMCKIKEGEVEYPEEPAGNPEPGTALICIAKPKSDKLVLEI